jgi:hypothetical protein
VEWAVKRNGGLVFCRLGAGRGRRLSRKVLQGRACGEAQRLVHGVGGWGGVKWRGSPLYCPPLTNFWDHPLLATCANCAFTTLSRPLAPPADGGSCGRWRGETVKKEGVEVDRAFSVGRVGLPSRRGCGPRFGCSASYAEQRGGLRGVGGEGE